MSLKTIKLELDIPLESSEVDQIADDLEKMRENGNDFLPSSLLGVLKTNNFTIFEVRGTMSVQSGAFTIVSGKLNNYGKETTNEATEKI